MPTDDPARDPQRIADSAVTALDRALDGRYRIEREVGRGGMAAVYLARDLRHDRPVAIKVLERQLGHVGAERFLQEIRVAARLTHPHVLGVHDSGEADGLLYYVMPYVEGETLRARLAREGALPIGDVLRLLGELAEALACAHGAGIVHRDLKPENILLSGGHAVVADFGIAKALAVATQGGSIPEALTGTGMSLGTPAYMAPEQAVGSGEVDFRADLYSLGVISYEALAGVHPFTAQSPRALVAAHLTEAPAPVAERRTDTPGWLAALVMQLLAKEPAARPADAATVLRTLQEMTPGPAAAPRPRRSLGVAALLAVATVVGSLLWRNQADSGAVAGAESDVAALRAIAVLPFDNTSGDPADEYFSVGMTDELAHALSRVPGLRIAGRTSSYAFKGRNVPAQDIGRALDVGTIVSGAVRRSGDRLRMTVQLVGTADGKVLSDSVYESRSSDIFAVQDEFTRAIVAALAQALAVDVSAPQATGDVGRGTRDQEAYDLYLRGRYHTLERGTDNLTQAIALFRQAISRDPGFARAHAGLAQAYGILPAYVRNASDSSIALMTASAERAIALDSTLADAQLALGMALDQRLRFTAAIRHYRTAIALEPANQFAHHLLGFALVNIGHLEEAVSVLRRATQLDPLAKSAASSLAAALTDAGQYAEAESTARRVLGLDSTFPIALGVLGYAQVAGAHPDEAVPTLERNIRLHPGAPGQRALLLYAYASSGRWEEAERMRTEIRHSSTDGTGAVEAAVAELVFGNSEPLASLLTRTEGQAAWFETYAWFGCHRLLDPIRSDPRFVLAMRELGVASCGTARGWSLPPRT